MQINNSTFAEIREYDAYKTCGYPVFVATYTTEPQSETEIVKNFFRKAIAIMDKSLAQIKKDYPQYMQ